MFYLNALLFLTIIVWYTTQVFFLSNACNKSAVACFHSAEVLAAAY